MNKQKLNYDTVTPTLKEVLHKIMAEPLFAPFILVGGTNLSLRYGHRLSVDIDMFTDAEYGSLDFLKFENWLRANFSYYYCTDRTSIVGFGRGYYIGKSEENVIKLDLMYTDPYIADAEIIDGIRMASVDDIIAMKMNVVSRGGRKKDFWDIHYLLNHYSIENMIDLHRKRHEWEHNPDELRKKLTDFVKADKDQHPICLLGKNWDDIKLDLIDI